MMKKHLFLALLTIGFGCSSVKSDMSFQKGKDSFWSGQYNEALVHLNKALELEPTSSRNHHQLALVHERMGNMRQAWEHARKAYSLNPQSLQNFEVFSRVFRSLAREHQFESPRKPTAPAIVDSLGVADKYLHNDHGDLKALYYGPVCFHIEQGKLASMEWTNTAR